MKIIKKYFIKRLNKERSEQSLNRNYPKSFRRIGIISNGVSMPDTNFITKLKIAFGDSIQISIFVLKNREIDKPNSYTFTLQNFNFFGELKDKDILSRLSNLDLIIDISELNSDLKSFLLNHSSNSYKIALGHGFCENCNLNINLKNPDLNILADEILKYHNILGNE